MPALIYFLLFSKQQIYKLEPFLSLPTIWPGKIEFDSEHSLFLSQARVSCVMHPILRLHGRKREKILQQRQRILGAHVHTGRDPQQIAPTSIHQNSGKRKTLHGRGSRTGLTLHVGIGRCHNPYLTSQRKRCPVQSVMCGISEERHSVQCKVGCTNKRVVNAHRRHTHSLSPTLEVKSTDLVPVFRSS